MGLGREFVAEGISASVNSRNAHGPPYSKARKVKRARHVASNVWKLAQVKKYAQSALSATKRRKSPRGQ